MKILHILGKVHLPQRPEQEGVSGVVRSTLETARVQKQFGHDVTVAVVSDVAWRTEWEGVRLISLPVISPARIKLGSLSADFRYHLPYMIFTARNKFNIVHGQMYSYLRFLRAEIRVIHFRSDPLHFHTNNPSFTLSKLDYKTIDRYSDAIIANSQFVAKALKEKLGAKKQVFVVHNGVRPDMFNPDKHCLSRFQLRQNWGIKEDSVVFLFAGAVVPEKGVIHLAHSFSRLTKKKTDIHLVIAGSSTIWGQGITQHASDVSALEGTSAYGKEVIAALEQPWNNGRVHFLGKVATVKMPTVYAAADVMVVPSIWREAFGNVALEAMAMGKPVIASRTGGIPEFVNESNGLLINPGDEEALQQAMAKLSKDTIVRQKLGQAARRKASEMSWQSQVQKIDEIYELLLLGKQ